VNALGNRPRVARREAAALVVSMSAFKLIPDMAHLSPLTTSVANDPIRTSERLAGCEMSSIPAD
jgi:hypothetical protein